MPHQVLLPGSTQTKISSLTLKIETTYPLTFLIDAKNESYLHTRPFEFLTRDHSINGPEGDEFGPVEYVAWDTRGSPHSDSFS